MGMPTSWGLIGIKGHEILEGGEEGPHFFPNTSFLTLLSGLVLSRGAGIKNLIQLWENPRYRRLCSWPDDSSVFLENRKGQAGPSSLRRVLLVQCGLMGRTPSEFFTEEAKVRKKSCVWWVGQESLGKCPFGRSMRLWVTDHMFSGFLRWPSPWTLSQGCMSGRQAWSGDPPLSHAPPSPSSHFWITGLLILLMMIRTPRRD